MLTESHGRRFEMRALTVVFSGQNIRELANRFRVLMERSMDSMRPFGPGSRLESGRSAAPRGGFAPRTPTMGLRPLDPALVSARARLRPCGGPSMQRASGHPTKGTELVDGNPGVWVVQAQLDEGPARGGRRRCNANRPGCSRPQFLKASCVAERGRLNGGARCVCRQHASLLHAQPPRLPTGNAPARSHGWGSEGGVPARADRRLRRARLCSELGAQQR